MQGLSFIGSLLYKNSNNIKAIFPPWGELKGVRGGEFMNRFGTFYAIDEESCLFLTEFD
jgi:hypothetical protein